jgi:hypothetical protein
MAYAICRNHQAILKKRDSPTEQNDSDQARRFVFQVAIPGKGHEDIGGQQETDGLYRDGDIWHGGSL